MSPKKSKDPKILEIVDSDQLSGRKKRLVITQTKGEDDKNMIMIDTGYNRFDDVEKEDQEIVIDTNSDRNTLKVRKNVSDYSENGGDSETGNGDVEIIIGVGENFDKSSVENNIQEEIPNADQNFVESCYMTYGTTKDDAFAKKGSGDTIEVEGLELPINYEVANEMQIDDGIYDKHEDAEPGSEIIPEMNQLQKGFHNQTNFVSDDMQINHNGDDQGGSYENLGKVDQNFYKKKIVISQKPEYLQRQEYRSNSEQGTITEEDYLNSNTTSEKSIMFNMSPTSCEGDVSKRSKGKLVINRQLNFKKKQNKDITIAYKKAKKHYETKQLQQQQQSEEIQQPKPIGKISDKKEYLQAKICKNQTKHKQKKPKLHYQQQEEQEQESNSSTVLDPTQIKKEFEESNRCLDRVLNRNKKLSQNLINEQQAILINPSDRSKCLSSPSYNPKKYSKDKFAFFKNSDNDTSNNGPNSSKTNKEISFNVINDERFFLKSAEDFGNGNFGLHTLTSNEFDQTHTNFHRTNGRSTDISKQSERGWYNFFSKHKKLEMGLDGIPNSEEKFKKYDMTASRERDSRLTTEECFYTGKKPGSHQEVTTNDHLYAKLNRNAVDFTESKKSVGGCRPSIQSRNTTKRRPSDGFIHQRVLQPQRDTLIEICPNRFYVGGLNAQSSNHSSLAAKTYKIDGFMEKANMLNLNAFQACNRNLEGIFGSNS